MKSTREDEPTPVRAGSARRRGFYDCRGAWQDLEGIDPSSESISGLDDEEDPS